MWLTIVNLQSMLKGQLEPSRGVEMIAAMEWTKVNAGRYTSPNGYAVERDSYVNSFSETRTQWKAALDGQVIWVGATAAKAKAAAERDAAKKAAGLCWFPTCSNPATGTTPGYRVSATYDIATCDACHLRAHGRPRTES